MMRGGRKPPLSYVSDTAVYGSPIKKVLTLSRQSLIMLVAGTGFCEEGIPIESIRPKPVRFVVNLK